MRATRPLRHSLALLLLFAAPVLAGDAPWRDAVDETDRPLLDRLLSADETVREAAAGAWEKDRLGALPEYGPKRWPPPPVGALSDEVDPLDPWAVRKKRMMTALVVALRQGEVPVQVAAARSLRDLAPAYTSTIDALAEALEDEVGAVRLAALETLRGITHLSGGRYVQTKMPDVVARIEDEAASVRALALAMAGVSLRYGQGDHRLRERALAMALRATADADASVRARALGASARMAGPKDGEVAKVLRHGLDDADAEVRRSAVVGLSRRPEAARPALDRLRTLLADEDFDARYAAAHAVWTVTRDATGLMPVMIEALHHFEGNDLVLPAKFLTVIGPPAEAATPGLVRALGRVKPARHQAMGSEIHQALRSIGPSPEIALPALEAEIRRRPPDERPTVLEAVPTVYAEQDRLAAFVVRMLAEHACPEPAAVEARVLFALGIETPGFVADAKARLASPDQAVGRRALYDLGRMRSAEALQVLVDLVDDPDWASGAIIALMDVGEHAMPAVPALVRALPRHPDLAATALVRTGGYEDPGVVKALRAALESAREDDKVVLCEAIACFGGGPEECLDTLIAALDGSEEMTRWDAARALGRWGIAAAQALPRLRRMMKEGDVFTDGISAAQAVWEISGEAGPTLELALRVAKSSHPRSWKAIHALHTLGPHAAEAVPLLIEAALAWREIYWGEDVMREAILALGAIGPAAAEALPVLRELERNVLVREEAREAIERITAAPGK